mgnify:FL=1
MKKKGYSLDKSKLKSVLKISDPFLMIDKVQNIIFRKSGVGTKKIKNNEWFYKCHFFNNDPVMPGTLQIESMLQTTIAVLYAKEKKVEKYLITKCASNFFSKISTSGEIKVNVIIVKQKRGIIESQANIFFNKRKIGNGSFTFINPVNLKIN